ncbi:MAG: bacillithiol system redox-active protein YtxJ [bacterium]
MDWKILKSDTQLTEIIDRSKTGPVAIYKHSITCPVSAYVKSALERNLKFSQDDLPIYYLDLVTYRGVSNAVAKVFGVRHQSPQVLVIREGKVILSSSHLGISVKKIKSVVS